MAYYCLFIQDYILLDESKLFDWTEMYFHIMLQLSV